MRSATLASSALMAATWLSGCGVDGGGDKKCDITDPSCAGYIPLPGTLQVRLTTFVDATGAIWVTVSGGTIDSVAPLSGYQLFGSHASTAIQAIVVGRNLNGNLFSLHVPDKNKYKDYQVHITQAAASGTYAQQPVGSYAALVAKAP